MREQVHGKLTSKINLLLVHFAKPGRSAPPLGRRNEQHWREQHSLLASEEATRRRVVESRGSIHRASSRPAPLARGRRTRAAPRSPSSRLALTGPSGPRQTKVVDRTKSRGVDQCAARESSPTPSQLCIRRAPALLGQVTTRASPGSTATSASDNTRRRGPPQGCEEHSSGF